jgi:hypothetical protein
VADASGDLGHLQVASAPTSDLWRWLAAVVSVTLGVILLALAVPRTVAAWQAMEGEDVFRAIAMGHSPANDRLEAALASLTLAVDWMPSADRYYMLASVKVERYRRLTMQDSARSDWLALTVRDLEHGLIANPANGRASLMLAVVRTWQGVSSRQVAAALLHSMDVAPSMRQLWLWRATYFLAAWAALTPEEVAAVRSQVRAIWRNDPNMRISLIQAALAAGRLVDLSAALSDEPGALVELERLKSLLGLRR